MLVSFTPDSMDVTQAVYGTRAIGTWTVRACNLDKAPVSVAAARIILEAQHVPVIEKKRALEMLAKTRRRSRSSQMGKALRWTTVVGTLALTTYTRASAKTVALAAGATALLEGVAREVEQGGPLTVTDSDILDGTLTLAGGDCTTKTVFASKIRGARDRSFTIKGL